MGRSKKVSCGESNWYKCKSCEYLVQGNEKSVKMLMRLHIKKNHPEGQNVLDMGHNINTDISLSRDDDNREGISRFDNLTS